MYIAILVGQILLAMAHAAWQTMDAMESIVVDKFGEDFETKDAEPYLYDIGFNALKIFGSETNKAMKLLALSDVIVVAAVSFLQ